MKKTIMISLIATALFIVVSLGATYTATEGVFGSVVGQSGTTYGSGNGFSNYGFLLHAVVFGAVMWFVLKSKLGDV